MLKLFLPKKHVRSVFDLKPDQLKKEGIKGIITDLDNTLVPWDEPHATSEVIDWLENMQKSGIKVTIISNNDEERVRIFSEPLEIPYVHSARKPLRRAFFRATKQMNLKRENVAVIGDQLLTDILGGNLGKFYTILVTPIVETDAKITQFNRRIERIILNYFERRGQLKRKEIK